MRKEEWVGGRKEGRKEKGRKEKGREGEGRKEGKGRGGRKEGKKANSIGHILLRNCLLKQVIEGKIEGQEYEE